VQLNSERQTESDGQLERDCCGVISGGLTGATIFLAGIIDPSHNRSSESPKSGRGYFSKR